MASYLQSSRIRSLLLGAICTLVPLGIGTILIGDIVTFVHSTEAGKALLEANHHTLSLFILLPFMFSIGLIALLYRPATPVPTKSRKSPQQRKKEERQGRWGQWYILYVFASILLALFAPIPQFFILNHFLSNRGYVFCPAPLLSRNQPDRWALPGPHGRTERCPKGG